MSFVRGLAFVMAGVALVIAGCDQGERVVDFDSCVLAHVSDAPTQLAANMAYEACESKFKNAEVRKGHVLTGEQLDEIAVEQRDSDIFDFSFRIYNGLSDVTLTELTVELRRLWDDRTWRFNMAVDIPPLTTGKDSFDVMDEVRYLSSDSAKARDGGSGFISPVFEHSVIGARGYPRE